MIKNMQFNLLTSQLVIKKLPLNFFVFFNILVILSSCNDNDLQKEDEVRFIYDRDDGVDSDDLDFCDNPKNSNHRDCDDDFSYDDDEKSNSIRILFVVDNTNSQQNWIKEFERTLLKDAVNSFVRRIDKLSDAKIIVMSCVDYTMQDHKDKDGYYEDTLAARNNGFRDDYCLKEDQEIETLDIKIIDQYVDSMDALFQIAKHTIDFARDDSELADLWDDHFRIDFDELSDRYLDDEDENDNDVVGLCDRTLSDPIASQCPNDYERDYDELGDEISDDNDQVDGPSQKLDDFFDPNGYNIIAVISSYRSFIREDRFIRFLHLYYNKNPKDHFRFFALNSFERDRASRDILDFRGIDKYVYRQLVDRLDGRIVNAGKSDLGWDNDCVNNGSIACDKRSKFAEFFRSIYSFAKSKD